MATAGFHFHRLLGSARKRLAGLAETPARLAGRAILGREESVEFLAKVECPAECGALNEIFCDGGFSSLEILQSGVVRIDGKACLDLDYGSRGALAGWRGETLQVPFAAALWSHTWMGYYHWIIDVLPKIALLQERHPDCDDFPFLVYPRTGTAYEAETLRMLGVPEDKLIDSRGYLSIQASRIAFSILPGWFEIQPAVHLLRKRMIAHGTGGMGKMIYLTRAGRRRCLNEAELSKALTNRGFTVVPDTPRSVAEQIGIFHDAEVIVALHGAALTNLLWCKPGTRVIECFPEHYHPPYYRNLSVECGIDYNALPAEAPPADHWSAVSEDITVDLTELERLLDRMKANEPTEPAR